MMSMQFHTGVSETILFSGWKTTSWPGMVGSVIGIILFGIIYEGLKNYREYLFVSVTSLHQHGQGNDYQRDFLVSSIHLIQTVLHICQFGMGYFLMLIFMTFNVWLSIAVIIGTGLGYWLFAWDKYEIKNVECCT